MNTQFILWTCFWLLVGCAVVGTGALAYEAYKVWKEVRSKAKSRRGSRER